MPDIVSPDVRSRMMSGIRGTNTKPELFLRHALHVAGFRFRLHVRNMPGTPDLVFPKYKAVLFANGCFWHGHDCHLFRLPSTRTEFWEAKINRNRQADARALSLLSDTGWRCGLVWECALKGKVRLPLVDVIEQCALWIRSNEPFLEIRGK
jgi:DNA mismatch endonuclease (patch repair protein)